MNTLITIGYISQKSAYLNVTKDEAISRYCEYHSMYPMEVEKLMKDHSEFYYEIKFEDEFVVYDAWGCN